MRFHCGISFRPRFSWFKWILLPLIGLLAYFGIFNITALAATSINLEPSSVELCNNATGSCSTNLLEKYVGTSSIRYSSVSGYSAISTFKVNYDSSDFSYYCYESEYNFHATYELDFAIAFRGVNPIEYGKFSNIKVYANNVEIPVISTYNSSTNYYHIKFDYPGYNNNIRIELVQDDSILFAYPLALYTLRNNSITCLDQTTLSSVNQSINNSTNTIINNNNNNTQQIIDSQNQINDSITDDTIDSSTGSGAGHFFGDYHLDDTRGFSNIVLAPIEFLRNLLTSADSCSPLSLPLQMKDDNIDSGVHNLAVPCGDILWNKAPTAVESIWFLLVWGLVGYRVLIDVVKFVNAMINPENSKEFFLEL